MRLARSGSVDRCFVIAWRSLQNVSIEYMQSLPSRAAEWV